MKQYITGIMVLLLLVLALPVQEAEALTTTVRVGYCGQIPPYQYADGSGKPQGFHVDVLEYIAEDEDLLLEYTEFDTTSSAMDALQEGNLDIVLGVVDNKFPGYDVRYSNPLSSTNLCLTATAEFAELYDSDKKGGFRIAAEYRLIDYTHLANLTTGNILIEQNQMSSIKKLVNGQVEMMVGVKDCLLWYFQEHDIDDNYVILNNYLASADFTVAVRAGDRHLYDVINSSLVSLRTSGEYESLYNSWLAHDEKVDYKRILKLVLYGVIVAVIFFSAYLVVNHRAKKKLTLLVEARTSELFEANRQLEWRTAQVEAENKLRYSIIESSPAGMVLIDENLKIEYMNSNALRIAGMQSYQAGIRVNSIRVFRELMEEAGEDLFVTDWTFKSGGFDYYKDKEKRNKEKYRYSIHKMTPHENVQGALITVENVTSEEKEREAAFEKEKNETLNSLIAGIAHEIKNPLTTISASAAMIQSKGDNEKFRSAFSTYIPQEIERITRLINSLIDYARPSSSKIEKVSMEEVLRSVVELAKVTAKNTQIEIALGSEDKLFFTGDRDKMKQSLLNIVINSVEATRHKKTEPGQQRRIHIEGYRKEDLIFVRVEDDGVGMSPAQLRQCTNPFYTTKPAGTGIGLALTKQYVEEVGGRLKITSEKDVFTCVELQLPAAEGKEDSK